MKRRARLSVCFRRLLWLSMRFLLVGAMFALAAGPIGESGAPAATSTWEGGGGDWSDDDKWTPGGAPDSETVDVEIDGGKTGTASTVTLNMDADVLSVTIDDGDAVESNNGTTLYVNGDGTTNNGTWTLNGVAGDASHTELFFRGSQTLGGTGTLYLGTDRDGYIRVGADADVITHGANHTIRGAGRILGFAIASGGMVNNGTIIAEGSSDSLRIWPGTPGFTNAGTLRAVGSGGLKLWTGDFVNTGQTIEVADGSRLELYGCALEGGRLAATGSHTGEIHVTRSSDFDGVTIASGTTVDQAANTNIDICNGLTNDGTWNLNGGNGVATTLTVHGSHTLGGTGEVVLSAHNRNRIRPSAAGEVITHGTHHTIRGGGRLLDNTGGMTNNGTILAEGSQQLVINPGDTDVFTNAGTLRAVGSGGLKLWTGDFVNTGQTIEVADGSRLELYGCALEGGRLAATGSHTGEIHVTFSSDLGGVTIDADTTVDQDNGKNVDIRNGLTNNGTWNLNSAGGNTGLFFDGSQTLGGTGEIVMSDNANNAVRGRTTGEVLTHGENHTIRGAGHVLWGSGSMVNLGAIIADAATTDMRIDPGAPDTFTNEGLVEVVTGSSLTSNGTLTQTGGTTRVDGELNVWTLLDIQGGVLTGTGTITGQTEVAGTFDPGASVGTLTFDLLDILKDAAYDCEIAGAASDLIHVTDTLTMDTDGPYTVDVICSGGAVCLGEHDMITWLGDDPLTEHEWGLLYQNSTVTYTPGYGGTWEYDPVGKRMYINITQTPEPATLALLALGGFGLFVRRRKV